MQIESTAVQKLGTEVVRFWAWKALNLQRAYKDPACASINFFGDLLYVTWAKLIRGRWCLVASSDHLQSQLFVFDGLRGFQSDKYVFYLDGPVMDGVVEDTPHGINLALSIGARWVLKRRISLIK